MCKLRYQEEEAFQFCTSCWQTEWSVSARGAGVSGGAAQPAVGSTVSLGLSRGARQFSRVLEFSWSPDSAGDVTQLWCYTGLCPVFRAEQTGRANTRLFWHPVPELLGRAASAPYPGNLLLPEPLDPGQTGMATPRVCKAAAAANASAAPAAANANAAPAAAANANAAPAAANVLLSETEPFTQQCTCWVLDSFCRWAHKEVLVWKPAGKRCITNKHFFD